MVAPVMLKASWWLIQLKVVKDGAVDSQQEDCTESNADETGGNGKILKAVAHSKAQGKQNDSYEYEEAAEDAGSQPKHWPNPTESYQPCDPRRYNGRFLSNMRSEEKPEDKPRLAREIQEQRALYTEQIGSNHKSQCLTNAEPRCGMACTKTWF